MIGKNRGCLSLAWMILSVLLIAILFSMAGLEFNKVYREIVQSPREEIRGLLMQATRAVLPWILTGMAVAAGSAFILKKKMTAAFKSSETKSEWETTFNTVSDMITLRDREFRILRINRAALKRYGMEEKALVGKKCFEVFHNLESPCKGCHLSEAMETRKAASGERWDPSLKGLFRYEGFPLYSDTGEVVGAISLTRDITEEKRLGREKEAVNNVNRILASNLDVRKVVKAVHSELKTILDSERMTITLLDETREGFRYFALEKDYGAGELITGVTYPRKETPLERVVESGDPVLVNDTHESDSWVGERLSLEGIRSLLVFPLSYKGNIIGTLNFGNRRAGHFSEEHLDFVRQIAPGLTISIVNSLLVEEMKASEERYRTVVETARDGVSVMGEDFRFNYVNEKMTEILGYTKEELIGSDFRALMDDKAERTLTEYFDRRQTGEEASPGCGLRIVRKDGEPRSVEISSTTVKDSHGRENTISFVKDVTEKRRMEEKLFQAEKLRALGEMASGVAHDFNNALAVILGNAQLLLFSAQDEETTESLKTIEKVVRDSAHTVRRLQEFTSHQIHREALQVDVNSLIRDVLELTRPRWKDEAQKNGIQIEVSFLPGEVPPVVGNSSEIKEVLTGLIFNATEAMPQGGRIEIKTFHRKGNAHIQISDTGTGMAEEVRKRVFEPFFTTKPFTNSGLGLSMSYGIIKKHGGEIEVKSGVGEGAMFSVILPMDPPGEELLSACPAGEQGGVGAIPDH